MCKFLMLKIIRAYQRTLSFDHGPMKALYQNKGGFCRFEPTCSEYTFQAIEKYGAIKGSYLGFKRILRCTPWTDGGFDPVE